MRSEHGQNGPNDNDAPSQGTSNLSQADSWATPEISPEEVEIPVSNFQLPPKILKNLTPISPRRVRRNSNEGKTSPIESRRRKLAQRSKEIEAKLANLKQRRERFAKEKIRSLNQSLDSATLRKLDRLEQIRQRARKFLNENIEKENSLQHSSEPGAVRCIMKGSGKHVNEANENYVLEHSSGSDSRTPRSPQVAVQPLPLFGGHSFFDKINKIEFHQAIKLLKKMRPHLVRVLDSLSMSGSVFCRSETEPYNSFFYAFVLINDFESCIRDGQHPGFNANADKDPQKRFYNNFIWLLLYKHAQELVSDFKALTKASNPEIKARFLATWNNYNDLFQIFKSDHFHNLSKLLIEALDIVDKQLEIFPNYSPLIAQKDQLLKQKSDLNHTESEELEEHFQEIIDSIKDSLHNLNINDSTYSPQHRILFTARVMAYNDYLFRIPVLSNVSALQWRSYWFERFIETPERNAPPMLKSGRVNLKSDPSDRRERLDVNEVFQRMGEAPLYYKYRSWEKFNERAGLSFFYLLNNIYNNIFAYISDFEPEADILDLRLDITVDAVISTSLKSMLLFIFARMKTLVSKQSALRIYSEVDKFCEILQNSQENDPDTFQRLVTLTLELETIVYSKWFNRCSLENHESFVRFENIYILISSERFSKTTFNIHTRSPSIMFPKFYGWMKSFKNYNQLNMKNYSAMSRAAFEGPRLVAQEHKQEARSFFTNLFFDLVLYGSANDFDTNELNSNFNGLLQKWNLQLTSIQESNIALMLILNYYSKYKNSPQVVSLLPHFNTLDIINRFLDGAEKFGVEYVIAEVITESLGPYISDLQIGEFLEYYKRSKPTIMELLSQKLKHVWSTENTEERFIILRGNFRYFHQPIEKMLSQIHHDLGYIYKSYHPLLNWIHMDLGCPEPLPIDKTPP